MTFGCISAWVKRNRRTWSRCDGRWAWWSPLRTLRSISCSFCRRDTESCRGRSSANRSFIRKQKRDGPCGTLPLRVPGAKLEEQLQSELDSPRDVALAACLPEVTVTVVGLPELIHGAEEDPVESVTRVRFEPEIFLFAEMGVFED